MQSECSSGSDFNKHETPFTNTNFLNQTICTVAVLLGNTCLHSFVNKKFQLQWISLNHLHCKYMCKLAPKEVTVELAHILE